MVAARERADGSADANVPRQVQTAIAENREVEDEALRDERAAADSRVRQERDARARMLTRILPLERDATDQYLLTERARSDDALATRDDFLGMVSHDLRDLLNGIVVSSQFLAEKLEKHIDRDKFLLELRIALRCTYEPAHQRPGGCCQHRCRQTSQHVVRVMSRYW